MNRVEIVAVGASLGGLAAIETLLKGLPASFRCPLVIVQHRRAGEDGRLRDLLQRHSSAPVIEPEDKEPLLPGRVYLAPAGYHLLVEPRSVALSLDAPVIFARPSIDVLFESVADAFGPGGMAVMLTGANEDGAAGAVAVKRAGGRVYVQDPATAESPAAPRAVLSSVKADGVLDLPALARLIAQVVKNEAGSGGDRTPEELDRTPPVIRRA
ncbi:MAG: chemotaxis protein CheB [Pseudomonadota bacterium]